MARSVHTRPLRVLAERRIRAPRERRGARDPIRRRRRLRMLKESGVVPEPGGPALTGDWPLPRIELSTARPGHHHPATERDVADVLRRVGPSGCYGLEVVELRRGRVGGSVHELGRLQVPGRILLFDQPDPPWRLAAGREERLIARMERAGAGITAVGDDLLEVSWPGSSLREFMLFEVLLHEVGHHLLQHHRGKRAVRVARTADHEAWADLFVQRCRERWAEES